ncbi:hypothetical protein [Streptomyces sp. NPDC051567]|uniref:hypothetical protein n=1 Tax=Streptomyces sp. NPDC051567 TaxID=3365660 RepID=UPI0037B26119
MSLTFESGGDATHPGGLDIRMTLTAEEYELLGADAVQLGRDCFALLMAVSRLRQGRTLTPDEMREYGPVLSDYLDGIAALGGHLQPRVQGALDAAVRAHAEHSGTIADLTRALGTPRSTAQSRRLVVTRRPPDGWETWAVTPYPHSTGADVAAGTAADIEEKKS